VYASASDDVDRIEPHERTVQRSIGIGARTRASDERRVSCKPSLRFESRVAADEGNTAAAAAKDQQLREIEPPRDLPKK
jgi:hypothetical protein